jgi:Tol biopolymer transport system component
MVNYDGSNPKKINISFPKGIKIKGEHGGATISPDRQNVFFAVSGNVDGIEVDGIYSCKLDGTNLHKLVETEGEPAVGQAF